MEDSTPPAVKSARLSRLQKRIEEQAQVISQAMVGSIQRVLVEGASRKSTGESPELMGRTECNRVVNFEGGPLADRLIGQMVDVRITKALAYTLRGDVVVN
jgi:tRNA-2-methylthio-N6-dimethylallyladenosine synthase